jgi:hypothetical protein
MKYNMNMFKILYNFFGIFIAGICLFMVGLFFYTLNINDWLLVVLLGDKAILKSDGETLNVQNYNWEETRRSTRSGTRWSYHSDLYFQKADTGNVWFKKPYTVSTSGSSVGDDIQDEIHNNSIELNYVKNKIEKAENVEVYYSKKIFPQETNEIYGLVTDGEVLINKEYEISNVRKTFLFFIIFLPFLYFLLTYLQRRFNWK